MVHTYITQDKVELFIFCNTNMLRQVANLTDKIEIAIETKVETKRFETTFGDLLTILTVADEKLSQSRKSKSD